MLVTSAPILALLGLAMAGATDTAQAKIMVQPYIGAPHAEFKTIFVPIDSSIFTDSVALKSVTELFLVGDNNALCTPFKDEAATVPGGQTFSLNNPALIATNPVVIGSIVCKPFSAGAN
jgi:hypothetical protein